MNKSLYRTFYNRIVLPAIWGGSRMLAPFIPKIRSGLQGREGLAQRVADFRSSIGELPVILFHCASAGELEALKPLAREFNRDQVKLAVSYFSPSARTVVQNSSEFDFADYSPVDSRRGVAEYYEALRPSVIAITKHDIWPEFVWQAQDREIPAFLINGNFHAQSMRLWPVVRQFHAAVYQGFSEIMTVSEDDAAQARRIVGTSVKVSAIGDSRFDRVIDRVQKKLPLPEGLEALCRGHRVIIAGSSHADDEQLLIPVLPKLNNLSASWRVILVPHDPSPKARRRIIDLCSQYGLKVRDMDRPSGNGSEPVILLNRTGVLADLYRLADVAYVGGGFGKGIHSVLEPMAGGVPVACGPNIVVSNEARVAKAERILTVVQSRPALESWLHDLLTQTAKLQSLRAQVKQFVDSRAGVSLRISRTLSEALHERAAR